MSSTPYRWPGPDPRPDTATVPHPASETAAQWWNEYRPEAHPSELWHHIMHPDNHKPAPRPGTPEHDQWLADTRVRHWQATLPDHTPDPNTGIPEILDIGDPNDGKKILLYLRRWAPSRVKYGERAARRNIASHAIALASEQLAAQYAIWRIANAAERNDLPKVALSVAYATAPTIKDETGQTIGKREAYSRINKALAQLDDLRTTKKLRNTPGKTIAEHPESPQQEAWAETWKRLAAYQTGETKEEPWPQWRRYTTIAYLNIILDIAAKKAQEAHRSGMENENAASKSGANTRCLTEYRACLEKTETETRTRLTLAQRDQLAREIADSCGPNPTRAHEWITADEPPTRRPTAGYHQTGQRIDLGEDFDAALERHQARTAPWRESAGPEPVKAMALPAGTSPALPALTIPEGASIFETNPIPKAPGRPAWSDPYAGVNYSFHRALNKGKASMPNYAFLTQWEHEDTERLCREATEWAEGDFSEPLDEYPVLKKFLSFFREAWLDSSRHAVVRHMAASPDLAGQIVEHMRLWAEHEVANAAKARLARTDDGMLF